MSESNTRNRIPAAAPHHRRSEGKSSDPAADPSVQVVMVGGVKSGHYPAPIKLGPRTTAWAVESIRALIAEKTAGEAV